jgi:hypothetical protein
MVSGRSVKMYRAQVQIDALLSLVQAGVNEVDGDGESGASDTGSGSLVNLWIPLAVVRHAIPALMKAEDKNVEVRRFSLLLHQVTRS